MFFKNKKPKISFAVIIYNKKEYINECIDSILSQNIDKEIICIDDHSTDGTYEILLEYAKKNKEIKVFRNNENKGTVYTRCEGLKHASGEYLIMVDADDKVIGSYNDLYNLAKSNSADIVEFSCETDDEGIWKKALAKENNKICGDLLDAFYNKKIRNTLCNKLISEKTYKNMRKVINTKVEQTDFSDAVYFIFHMLNNARIFISTDKIGYFYYSKRGMTTHISNTERLKQLCGFIYTKRELESIYGEMKSLNNTWNYICNQAVDVYMMLDEKSKKENKYLLYELMSKANAEFLITEVAKEHQK